MANANIFSAYAQPMRSVADYEDHYAQRDLRAQQLQAAQQQNALQALTMRQTQAQMADTERKRNAIQQVYQGLGASAGDPEKLIAALKANPDAADAGYLAEEKYLKRRETESKIGAEQATTGKTAQETAEAKRKASLQQVASLNSPEEGLKLLQSYTDRGEIHPQIAQAIGSMIRRDPKWQLNLMMGIADPSKMADMLTPHMQTANVGGQTVMLAGDKRTGAQTVTGSIANTQSPDSVAKVGEESRHNTVMEGLATDKAKKPAQLPTAALKMQQESVDAIGTASAINADLGAVAQQIGQGKLKFGPVSNLANRGLNAAGLSTEESRNFASFQATMEKLRNDSLRLNKGVQTDGDAQRAWNELFNNINDTEVVKQRLAEIQNLNERAVKLHQLNIDNVRSNYGLQPYEAEAAKSQPAAIGQGGAPSGKTVVRTGTHNGRKVVQYADGTTEYVK